MRPEFRSAQIGFAALCGALLTGCLLKTTTVTTRHFVLAPMPVERAAPPNERLSVEVGFVKMPAYLLHDSIVVRSTATEITYLEDGQWCERLDHCLERTIAINLSQLLPSDNASGQHETHVKVFVIVQQFDVDTGGAGTLIAQWRTTFGDNVRAKSGQARFTRPGAAPRGNPDAIARTMSELTADLSRELARSIRESGNGNS